jgi:hypothetical protein
MPKLDLKEALVQLKKADFPKAFPKGWEDDSKHQDTVLKRLGVDVLNVSNKEDINLALLKQLEEAFVEQKEREAEQKELSGVKQPSGKGPVKEFDKVFGDIDIDEWTIEEIMAMGGEDPGKTDLELKDLDVGKSVDASPSSSRSHSPTSFDGVGDESVAKEKDPDAASELPKPSRVAALAAKFAGQDTGATKPRQGAPSQSNNRTSKELDKVKQIFAQNAAKTHPRIAEGKVAQATKTRKGNEKVQVGKVTWPPQSK